MFPKIFLTIILVTLILLSLGVVLSAQEEDNKKVEITCYLGKGGQGTEGAPIIYEAGSYGLGIEYYFTHHISVEGEINYLPDISCIGHHPFSRSEIPIKRDEKYRLLWNLNFLFYFFDLTKIIKKPTVRFFLTGGIGYQYDREEYIIVSIPTLRHYKCECGEFFFQFPTLGAGIKVNIIDSLAVKFLYKIHLFGGEERQTNRYAIGLSYRF